MSFELSDDQRALAEAAAVFTRREILPTAAEDDQREIFRKDVFHKLGEQGFCGITTPERFGGLGLGYAEYLAVLEEIAKVSPAYAVTVSVNNLPQLALLHFGNEELQERYVGKLASGEWLATFALSESHAGSDASALRCRATRDGDHYVLNGTKAWITSGPVADLHLVMARTGDDGARGISTFLVEAGLPGIRCGRPEDKMGFRASPTTTLSFEDVRVPAGNRIGREGIGFTIAMKALDSGRITIGSVAVGIAQAALDASLAYACEREQFGQRIVEFQGVSFLLADMAMAVDAARLMVRRAAALRDAGRDHTLQAAMAKCLATDTAMRVTTDAVQVLAGNGYTREYPVERMMRDAKVTQIFEGTNQIQRVVIGRHLERSVRAEPG